MKIDKTCESMLSQARGLMFSRKKVLLFKFRKPKKIMLHNWFVFYPINLVFLDESKKVIEIRLNFRPFRFYTSKIKSRYLIETPYKIRLKIGDKIKF